MLFVTIFFRNRGVAVEVPPVMWGMAISAYLCLCCVSIFFISRWETRHNLGITLLAQGVLLPVISVYSGAMLLGWVGFTLFLVGLVISFFHATRGSDMMHTAESASVDNGDAERERIDRVLEKMGIPVCFSDPKGMVLGATDTFYEVTGRGKEETEGEVIADVIPIDDEYVTYESGKWYITQTRDGERFYFTLTPTPDGKPMEEPKQAPQPQEGYGLSGIFDATTGLYTDEYRRARGPEEVSRAQRYKRSLSGMLLELFFNPTDNVDLTDRQKKMLKDAFATRVKGTLRTMDLGFLMEDERIQILLPETPQAGAKTLVGRLMTLPHDVFDDEIREAVNPKLKAGVYTYAGTSRMEYAVFCATLEQAFATSKEGVAGTATVPVAVPGQAA
jgi:PAS domain-containing protein